MQEEAKLIVAEQKDKQKIEFLIFEKQIVGKGMSGEVKKAIRNDKKNELLVVKIIPCENETKRQKIDKEIGVIKHLSLHPNLVRVEPYECFSKNNYYIFMEYCPGGTLEDLRIKKNNIFSEEEIFDIFYQLMNGYRVLWEAKILHQDLKPENVLVKDNKLKLADFGFSIFYEGVKHGSVRVGTLPYMPLEKLTEKEYYATTKSDMYSMGVILFKLITGHHPYVEKSNKDFKSYVRELKMNPFYLKPKFSSRFSIKFQHFFDLVCKMVAKEEKDRIDFNVIYEYIENETIFNSIREKVKIKEQEIENQFGKVNIIGESEAVAIDFEKSSTLKPLIHPDLEEIEAKQLLKLEQEEEEKIVNELDKYIASHRIIVYYFDRLTRRLFIEKTKKNTLNLTGKKNEKLILALILFCKKIVQSMLKECKTGMIYPINNWRIYRKKSTGLLKMIERDENYLEDMLIDSLSESIQTQMIEKKQMIEISKQSFDKFKEEIICQLNNVYKDKKSLIEMGNRQNLITLCYIKSGLTILNEWDKYSTDALEFEGYFRSVETLSSEELFSKFLHEDDIEGDMVIDIGDEQ